MNFMFKSGFGKRFFSSGKNLFVFDFDETIIQHNSDTYFYKILPGSDLPQTVKQTLKPGHWLDFMRNVCDHLEKTQISPMKIKETLEEVPLTNGFKELLEFLHSNKNTFDSIIISNANTLFVDWILEKHGLKRVFNKVFTNPASIVGQKIQILNYHSHNCLICSNTSVNLCKKTVLLEYLKGKEYGRICYAGDGFNDFCPTTILKKNDLVFPRKDFPLSQAILKRENQNSSDQAKIVFWTNGLDILKEIKG